MEHLMRIGNPYTRNIRIANSDGQVEWTGFFGDIRYGDSGNLVG